MSAAVPLRVRRLTERLRDLAVDEFERAFVRMWADIDRRLMQEADRAHTAGQAKFFDARRVLSTGAPLAQARFLEAIGAQLTALRPWQPPMPATGALDAATADAMALIDHEEMHESGVLQAMASRHAARASLGLHLLGQRMAVLACAPAMDIDVLPLGPTRLCEAFADALAPVALEADMRLMVYRSFDSSALASYAGFVENLNSLLDREDVLPGLAYVPLRVRPTLQAAAGDEAGAAPRARSMPPPPDATEPLPFDAWQAPMPAGGGQPAATGFDALRHLLASHRSALAQPLARGDVAGQGGAGASGAPSAPGGLALERAPGTAAQGAGWHAGSAPAPAPLSTAALLDGLAQLQHDAPPSGARTPGATLHGLRDALLTRAAQATGAPAALSVEDSDTFELLGLLFAQIGRELRTGSAGQALLSSLEMPLARLALQDRGFFSEAAHPARRLLNTVAEAHAACLDDEPDPQTRAALHDTVQELAADPQGAAGAFDRANQRMEAHLQALARKAELAERRQVEAARGKEKLTLAKRAAAAVISEAAGRRPLPRFVRTLLEQTWQDVLTLSWLRHGAHSEHWHSRVATTAEIIALHTPGAGPAAVDLQARIAEALELVGHAASQAQAVARRMVSGVDPGDAEAAERAPLSGRAPDEDAVPREPLPARNADEEDSYRHLRSLPYGTWFDFTTNQQGDLTRRRMSWYSVVTGNALFVNSRGQRVAEYTLDALARLMASGQARVVTVTRARLIDRAWQATLDVLRVGPRAAEGAPA